MCLVLEERNCAPKRNPPMGSLAFVSSSGAWAHASNHSGSDDPPLCGLRSEERQIIDLEAHGDPMLPMNGNRKYQVSVTT